MHNKISYGNVLFLNRKKMEDANKFEDSKSNEPKAITILAPITHSDNILKSCVWCVAWNASGSLLASCGDDKIIRVWKLLPIEEKLELLTTIRGDQSRTIRYVSFSPCSRYFSSASFDASIIIYEFQNGDFEEIHKIEGHENEVKCCEFSVSGEFLATCSRDKTVWVWKIDEEGDYEVDSILQSHTADVKFVQWHPIEELLVSGGYDWSIRFYHYDGEDWITQQKIDSAHDDTIWAGAFDMDGEHFATVGADHVVKVWKRGGERADVDRKWSNFICHPIEETQWPLYTVAWRNSILQSDGTIAVGGGDRILRLFTFDEKNATLFLSAKIRLDGEINCLRWKEQKKSKNKKDIDCDDESAAEEKSALLAAACDNGMVYLLKHHFQ